MSHSILFIDDEKDFVDLASTMLEFHDFKVTSFEDPAVALETAKDQSYDLIITDLMMPNIDGFHLIAKFRGMDQFKKTPIIVLTAKSVTDEERKFLLKHDAHLIIKPFQPQNLVDMARTLCSDQSKA